MDADPNRIVHLTGEEKTRLVEEKVTCPFVGSAVAEGKLAVRNELKNPLACIDEVGRLGNTGDGDLGDLLVVFAAGNHARMNGGSGKLDTQTPNGLFSLEFPGSQGSHCGHSGILQGDPTTPGSGRFSQTEFTRLARCAKGGLVKRSDVGRFIAENLVRDPKAKVFGSHVAAVLAADLFEFVRTGPALLATLFGADAAAVGAAHRAMEERLTKLLGEDNLVGSAGEFGLLFALLANQPGRKEIDGEPAVALQDLEAMFVHKRLPAGWETWKKSRVDWVKNTLALLISAAEEYVTLVRAKHQPSGAGGAP